MAISYVSVSSADSGLLASAPAVTAAPAGVVAYDTLIAKIILENESRTITPPAGWVEIPIATNVTNHKTRWYRKFILPSDLPQPANYSFALTGTTSWVLGIAAFRGAGFVSGSSATSGSVVVHVTNTVTVADNDWLLAGWSAQALATIGWGTGSGGMTEIMDRQSGILLVLNATASLDYQGPMTAGNYTKTSVTPIAVDSINSLLRIEQLDVLTATELDGFGSFGGGSLGLTVTANELDGFGLFSGDGEAGFVLVANELDGFGLFGGGEIIPGEVILTQGTPLDAYIVFDTATINPGEVILGVLGFVAQGAFGAAEITPGEVAITQVNPLDGYVNFDGTQFIILGMLLTQEDPLNGYFIPDANGELGLEIGFPVLAPFLLGPPDFAGVFGSGTIFTENRNFEGPCCSE